MACREMVSYGDLEMAEPPPFVEPPEHKFSDSSAGETASNELHGLDSQMTARRNRGNLWMDSADRRMQNNPVADERNGGFKLFVTGLGPTTDVDALKKLFGEFGTVMDAFVKEGNNGKFAFVSLSTIEEGEKASAALGHREIDGSRLRVSWAKPPRNSLPGSTGSNAAGTTCFKCGQTGHRSNNCDGTVKTEPNTAPSTAWGAAAAEGENGKEGSSGSNSATAASESVGCGWGFSGSGGQIVSDSSSRPASFSRGNNRGLMGEACPDERNGGFKLNITGLASSIDADRLKELFGKSGSVKDAFVKENDRGKFAFVSMETVEQCEAVAAEFGGKDVDGSRLRISWARPRAAGGNTNGKPGGSSCFKCGQSGHRAAACPGGTSDSAPVSATSDTCAWGAVSTETTGSSAWSTSTPASSKTASTPSGWADKPAETPNATSGGWGSTNPTSNAESSGGGWGSGDTGAASNDFGLSSTPASGTGRNTGLTGDPCPDERHGGFKLNLFGIANSVDGERLKDLFGKSGTVKDVFIKDGEKGRFGFVTMETVEQCEAAAASLGGMTIDGSRLKISWARPRAGNQSSSGPKPAGTCFKCGQSGHRSFECPGSSANAGQLGSAETSSSGWGSVPAASNESSTGGGWGSVPAASNESGAGWGSSVGETASGGSSGQATFSKRNNGGLMGEPCPDERNGGFKLNITGLASSIDADRLKELFAKSGCVKDAFVKENDRGKFAFVSMETVEQCEAVAAEFSGTNIDGSRLKISWARPRTGGGNTNGHPGGSACFKCGQSGHRAAACPGGTSSSSSVSAPSDTSAWGTGSTETTGSSGWSTSTPASSETSSTPSGWADKPAADSNSTAVGSWGEKTDSSSGGWGSTNPSSSTDSPVGGWGSGDNASTPASGTGRNAGLTGEPCPDDRNGGFKLNLFGIANSVDGERLKDLFGKSGTVKDVFIKDGEKGRFGFVTMETVEQCEAAAASLGGMTIDGSRLKISWARPRPGNQNSSGPKPASGTCFKCGQTGHRSFECSGSNANSVQVASTETTSSGWGSVPTASNESSAGGGWGSVPAASNESSAGGGWGSVPAASNESGGGWGSSGDQIAGSGSSGPASFSKGNNCGLMGEPCPDERNGGFKLNITGLASAIDADRLKELFAKSGCVKDAFVKENDRGKFAFVSMETVEQCEAVAAEFGGKNIDGSRLKIFWARPRPGGGNTIGTPGGSACFKCGQTGHRAAACPGGASSSASISTPSDTSAWGTASTEATGTSGWTNPTPASSETSTTPSGWADMPTAASNSTAAGGWGEKTESTSGGWGSTNPTSNTDSSGGGWNSGDTGGTSNDFGSSGTTTSGTGRNSGLTGDPCPDERHGGFKLNLFGIANSVDGERLKDLFGKSGTVKDVFIKDGEKGRFGFVTMETVEQCEAAAASLGGMTIDGSRLKISWARPRPGNQNSSGPKPAGTCFKCGQSGHRSFECPGSSANSVPLGSAETSSSGWGSVPAASTDSSAGGGWGSAPVASTESSAGGGWGSSGDQAAGGGSSGPASFSRGNNRGLMGEPCPDERNGGFKLNITGLASSIDADRLKEMFGKSGSVKDAFVKENDGGKFAFVSMDTVEQCEAVAAEFGGKDVDGSRLKISWARPRPGGGNTNGNPGGSSCFKCGQSGHRAAACPGGTSNSSSVSAPSDTSAWGTASTEATGSSGWANSAPASSESSNTTSGWGDKPAEASNSTAAGGWGEKTESSSGGWGSSTPASTNDSSAGGWGSGDTGGGSSDFGSSGTPASGAGRNSSLTVDPCPDERHGGFKLNLTGIANSVDGERLKDLFGKSGTVKDVFIKDGEKGRFGFVTMETVEQCEAAAASLSGMTIDGSRFRISWARARPGNPSSSGPKPASGACFKCGQSGHRSFECPGSKANTTSADTSSSGWDSAPAATKESGGGGGWDNAGAGDQGGWGDSSTTPAAPSDGNAWVKTEENVVKEEACGLKEYLKLKKLEQLEEQERLVNEILESKALVERLKKQKQTEALRIERARNMAPRVLPPPRSLPKSRMYPDMFTPEEREIAARQYGIAKIQTQKEREHFLFSGERTKADILADAEESMNGIVQLSRRSDSPEADGENYFTPVAPRKRPHTQRSDPVPKRIIQSTNSRNSRAHEESPEFAEPTSKSDDEDEEYRPAQNVSSGKKRKSVHFNQTVEVFQDATGLFAPDEPVSSSTRGNKRPATDSSTPKESGAKRKQLAVMTPGGSPTKITVNIEQVATAEASNARYETRSRKKKSVFGVDPNSRTPILDMMANAAERRKSSG